jgi:hypothetical protein
MSTVAPATTYADLTDDTRMLLVLLKGATS